MTGLGAVLLLAIVAGCSSDSTSITPVRELVFLTRDGCGNSAIMRARVEEALRVMGLTADYTVLNLATLPADDPRRGYPIPTLLYGKRDIFGLVAARPPYSAPTCRVYSGGVPPATDIQANLLHAMRESPVCID